MSGFGNVFGTAVNKGFQITGGNLNGNSFSLVGFTYNDTCGTSTSTLTQQVTLTGECGTGVTIHYQDTGGQQGDFVGNVACS